jgi:hypothetical protein
MNVLICSLLVLMGFFESFNVLISTRTRLEYRYLCYVVKSQPLCIVYSKRLAAMSFVYSKKKLSQELIISFFESGKG